jgi:hypothetical protein
MTNVAPFKNQHLSYSRLSRFETCPLSYRLHYIEKKQAEPGLPLRFGKTIHAVLERLIKEVVDDERTGPLSEERAIELYREAWGAEQLTGMDVFAEGLGILRRFIADQGVVDHRDVLAIEKEFRLPVGPFEVLGFIDLRRLDRRRDRRGHRLQDQPPALHPRRGRHLAADEPLRGGGAPPLAVGEEGEADLLDVAPRRPARDDAHRGAARRRARLRRDARAADGDRDGIPGAPQQQLLLLRPPQAVPGLRRRAQGQARVHRRRPRRSRRRRPRARGGRAPREGALRAQGGARGHPQGAAQGARGARARRRSLPDVRDHEPRLPARADALAARRRDGALTRRGAREARSHRQEGARRAPQVRWARSSTSRASRC